MRDDEVYALQNPDNPLHDIWYNRQQNLNLQNEIKEMRYPEIGGSRYDHGRPVEVWPSNEFLSHRDSRY